MGERQKEVFAKRVLNTQRGRTQSEERIDVTVLASDYAKIRSMARKTNHTLRTVLRDIVVAGVRNLAAEAIVLSIVCLALPAFASRGGATQTEERAIGQLDADSAALYRSSMESRKMLREECAVLERIFSERERDWRSIGDKLESRYGMTLSQNYSYSDKDMTLYLVLTNGLAGSSPENPVLRAHRAFFSEEDAKGFVDMVAERNAAADKMNLARRLKVEKDAELAQVEDTLRTKFGVTADGEYRFDNASSTLFAVVPKPSDEELRIMRETEERALRDARERAKARQREEARAKAEAEAAMKKAKAEAEAKAKAERLAKERAKAEAEAKAKAERRAAAEKAAAEKKAKAEAEEKERKRRQAMELRMKAQREAEEKAAKAKAEAEKKAKAKARAEAEAKAAAEKKARAEAEKQAKAKAKAEAEAKAAAEKKAKAEAERQARERAKIIREREKLHDMAWGDAKRGCWLW